MDKEKSEELALELLESTMYLQSFVPPWVKDVQRGLCPTMYGTGSYGGDLKVSKRVKEIEGIVRICCG